MKKADRNILIFAALLLVLFLLLAVYQAVYQKDPADEDTPDTATPPIDYRNVEYTWNAAVGTEKGDTLIRGRKIDDIKDDLDKLVYASNRTDEDPESFRTTDAYGEPLGPPKLKIVEIQPRMVTVEVINARYLTQRMGTTGAEAYLAEATFTLTEHEGVDAVFFTFEEGSHAAPGIYTRKMFEANWNVTTGIDGI